MTYPTRSRSLASQIVLAIGALIAIILVTHIVLDLVKANPANGFVSFIAKWAGYLAVWFKDLFTPGSHALRVILNYGLAAVFWLVVAGILARLLSRL